MSAGFTHESSRARSVEWYTPPWIFEELAIEFDLDPCHPVKKLPWIPVKNTFNRFDNGLLQSWNGRVWLNPPYGKETGQWMRRLAGHGNGIALVFSRTDTNWFHESIARADAVLFIEGRIDFVDGSNIGNPGSGAGSVMAAYGAACVEALERLSYKGWLIKQTIEKPVCITELF